MKNTFIIGLIVIMTFFACNKQSPNLLCFEGYAVGDSIDINEDKNIEVWSQFGGVDGHGEPLRILEFSRYKPDPRLGFISKKFNIIRMSYEGLVEDEYQSILSDITVLINSNPEILLSETKSGSIRGEEHIYTDSVSGNIIITWKNYCKSDSVYSIYVRNFLITDPIEERYKVEHKDPEYDFVPFDE